MEHRAIKNMCFLPKDLYVFNNLFKSFIIFDHIILGTDLRNVNVFIMIYNRNQKIEKEVRLRCLKY